MCVWGLRFSLKGIESLDVSACLLVVSWNGKCCYCCRSVLDTFVKFNGIESKSCQFVADYNLCRLYCLRFRRYIRLRLLQ